MSGHLNPGGQQFRGDRGGTDPRVAAALAAWQCGQGSEQAALTALAVTRLLVPVIAVLAGPAPGVPPPGGDKNSEMVMPTLIGRDGRPAVLAFTGLDALARWRPDARPVPAEAGRVWRAAVTDGAAVVIDVAGPVPLAVEGARLAALAAGQPVPPPHQDPDVRSQVEAALTEAAQAPEAGTGRRAGHRRVQPGRRPSRSHRPGRPAARDRPGLGGGRQPRRGRHRRPLAGRLRRGIEVIIAERLHQTP